MGGKGKKRRNSMERAHHNHQKSHHHKSPQKSQGPPPRKRARVESKEAFVSRSPVSRESLQQASALQKLDKKPFSLDSAEKTKKRVPKNLSNVSGKETKKTKQSAMDLHRRGLPIFGGRSAIINHVKNHDSTIIVGETGSGKTTQIPQYLYEAGLHKTPKGAEKIIGITQPRRVAAMSVSRRVAEEMNVRLGELVGYSVRFDSVVSSTTKVKFLTDGMLLREAMLDPSLSKYSMIVLDEAHERTLQTDILFSVLKRIQRERRELINATKKEKVEGGEKGAGGRTRKVTFPLKLVVMSATLDAHSFGRFFDAKVLYIEGRQFPVTTLYTEEPEADYLDATLLTVLQIHLEKPPGDILVFLTGRSDIEAIKRLLEDKKSLFPEKALQMEVFPIFSSLPHEQQMKIFEGCGEGVRKVILATNIAETSLTINGIRYVIDCGLCKQRGFNPKTGIDSLLPTPISKAAARQRAGRAGREAPGSCYRLYPEPCYHDLYDSTIPEIQRCSLDHVVLQLKSIGVHDVLNFEYMSPPPTDALRAALTRLHILGGLDKKGKITNPVGRSMAALPILPMFSRTILEAAEQGVLPHVLRTVAMLAEDSSTVFFSHENDNKKADAARMVFASPSGDHLTLLNVYTAFEREKTDVKSWCKHHFISHKTLKRAREVFEQLVGYCEGMGLAVPDYEEKSEENEEVIEKVKRSFAAGFFLQAAIKQPNGAFVTVNSPQTVYMHPGSTLFSKKPECVIFTEVVLTTKLYMREVLAIERTVLNECVPQYASSSSLSIATSSFSSSPSAPASSAWDDE